ncbi:MAG: FHA domain-containing protein [Chloroflexi bacterium]|nr:FHA domain-containing protein [Chloroflexota bacterium]
MYKRLCRFALLSIWLLLLPISADAQAVANAILTPPVTDNFPRISAYLEVYDGQGDFAHNLREEDVFIIEDEQPVPVSELIELETGAQFVVALNLGPTFAIRDINGISRYDDLQQALTEWANTQPASSQDDLSFLTNDEPEHIHLATARQWLSGLETYTTDPRAAIPSLDVLVRAIAVAADPPTRPGMGRAVLILTPPPDRAGTAALQSIISLAKQERIRVHVWMVSSPAYFTTEGATQLAELAHQTGGQFFTYSGEESIPNIESYLEPLRYIYSLAYESRIVTDAPHQIAAHIETENLDITTEPQSFELSVLPPNPIFVSPPLNIFRANRAPIENALTERTDYTPAEQPVEILIEFPDGRVRPLVRTTLYVDGSIAGENTAPPFDKFTWDLSEYTSSGTHLLQVEALDSMGLSGISIETTVQVTVQRTPQSIAATIAQNGRLIASVAAALAGGILMLVLIVGGRIRPKSFGRLRGKSATQRQQKKNAKTDPVTQPVAIKPLIPRRSVSGWRNRLSWPQRRTTPSATIAYLEPLTETKGGTPDERIPITSGEITFGKDPILATAAFNDPSVADLHARLRTDSEGHSCLFDEGSTAGTWVNYNPISPNGTKLAYGDIIHFGRIGLRFKLSDKKQIPKPVVKSQEPNRDS